MRLAQYVVLPDPPDAPQTALDERFGDTLTLTGYALSDDALAPGDVLGVTLFWQADAPLPERYKVSAQLLAPDGTLSAQHDAEPNNNRAPTTAWQPSDIVIDTHGLTIPPGSAGEYIVKSACTRSTRRASACRPASRRPIICCVRPGAR